MTSVYLSVRSQLHFVQERRMASREDNYKAGRHEECKSAPHNANKEECPRQTPRNEERVQFNRSHEGPRRSEPFSFIRDDEQRRRTILEAIEKGQPYKNLARRLLENKGQYDEQEVNSVTKHVYDIDNNQGRFVFQEKLPGRMHDSNKSKRTDVGLVANGRLYSYQTTEPEMIIQIDHSIENTQQVITLNPGDSGKQLISHPSKEKYGYLPQFHQELDSSMPASFGNSENIEVFLVGGKEKLQEMRRDLNSHSSEINKNDIDGSVLSADHNSVPERKKFTLWGVDIYEEDFKGDDPEAVESSQGRTNSTD